MERPLSENLVQKCLYALKKHASSLPIEIPELNLEITEQNRSILNDTLIIHNKRDSSKTLCISHAPPHIKFLGPEYPLPVGRTITEYRALCRMNEILPDIVPKLHFYDSESSLVCTDSIECESLRECLMKRQVDSETAEHIARYIATIHSNTHCNRIPPGEFKDLCDQFGNDDLLSVSEQLTFTRPFARDDPTNNSSEEVKPKLPQIYEDERLLAAVEAMKKLFLGKKECLIHGDFHTGSILVKHKDIKFTNLTFTHVGPGSYDVGTLIANYIFSYYHHMSLPDADHEQRRAFANFIIEACRLTVRTYLQELSGCVDNQEEYEKAFMTEVAGFAGCEIIRRIIGAVHVEDLEGIQFAEEDALGAGIRLLQGYRRIHTADFLLVVALMLT